MRHDASDVDVQSAPTRLLRSDVYCVKSGVRCVNHGERRRRYTKVCCETAASVLGPQVNYLYRVKSAF